MPGATNFTAVAPKVVLPTPMHQLDVHTNATAQWTVMVSTGDGMATSFTKSVSVAGQLCRECVPTVFCLLDVL